MSYLKTIVVGFLGSDCRISNVNGKDCIHFSIAVGEKYKNAQGVQMEKTLWVSASYWPQSTAIAQYLKKGTLILAEGKSDVGIYQDKQSKWQAEFKLRVSNIQLLGSNPNNQQGSQGNCAQRVGHGQQGATGQLEQNQYSAEIAEPLDDLPF